MKNKSGLAINNTVIAQIAKTAALEVEGVSDLGQKPFDFKGVKEMVVAKSSDMKSVSIAVDSGVLIIDIYIRMAYGVRVKSVAEAVQQNVKEKVQNMTGNAVAKVNVIICDVEAEPEPEIEIIDSTKD